MVVFLLVLETDDAGPKFNPIGVIGVNRLFGIVIPFVPDDVASSGILDQSSHTLSPQQSYCV
jgi:hypothetical protein